MNDAVWEPQQKLPFHPHPPFWHNHCIAYEHAHSHDLAAALTVADCRMKGYLTRLSQLALLCLFLQLAWRFALLLFAHPTAPPLPLPGNHSINMYTPHALKNFVTLLALGLPVGLVIIANLNYNWNDTPNSEDCQFCSRSWIFISHSRLQLRTRAVSDQPDKTLLCVYVFVCEWDTHNMRCLVTLHCMCDDIWASSACLPVFSWLPSPFQFLYLFPALSLPFPLSLFFCLSAVGQSPCQHPKIILEYQISFVSR